MKLKIGIIMQSPDIGGAETFMMSLIKEFVKKGSSVYVASNKGKFFNLVKNEKIKSYEIPIILDIIGDLKGFLKTILLLPYAFYFYLKLLNKFKKENVDVILMSNFTEKLFVSLLSPFFKIPVVWIEYGSLREVFKKNFYIPKTIYRLLCQIPMTVIVPSLNTKNSLISDAHVAVKKIKLIPLGIKDFNLPLKKHKGIVVGCISRITPEKGQQFLISAMPKVIKEVSDVKLLIVGSGSTLNDLKKLAKEIDVEKNVEFVGFVSDVTKYYGQMDIFVFPSVWELEGFGLVLIEAMSHKLSIIASNIGPTPEIVDNGKTGYLVDIRNRMELSMKIIELAKDSKKRKKMGEAGYQKFKKEYVLENAAEKFYNILNEAVIN